MANSSMQNPKDLNRSKTLFNLVVISLTILCVVNIYFPKALEAQNQIIKTCPKQIYHRLGYECGEFDATSHPIFASEVSNLTPKSQFILLKVLPTFAEAQKTIEFDLVVSSFAVHPDRTIKRTIFESLPVKLAFNCTTDNKNPCQELTFAKILEVKDDHYIFVLKFTNNEQLQTQGLDLELAFVAANHSFYTYFTYFKYLLFVTSLIAFAIYRKSVAEIPEGYTSIQQDQVEVLALTLIFFNQPFVSYSYQDFYFMMFGTIVTCYQSTLLIMFWLTFIERLASQHEYTVTQSVRNAIRVICTVHFIISVIGYYHIAEQQIKDPLTTIYTSNMVNNYFRYYLCGFVVIITAWTIIRLFTIIPRLSQMSWRDQTTFHISVSPILFNLFFILTGNLQSVNYKTAMTLFLSGILTVFVLVLEVLYAPFYHEVDEAKAKRRYDRSLTANTRDCDPEFSETAGLIPSKKNGPYQRL